MMRRSIHVLAPSRLHYGMLSFGHPDRRQYGGIGMMVREPHLELTIRPADDLSISGPLSTRVGSVVQRAWEHWRLVVPIPCSIDIMSAPAEHHGLGCGTQLALAVAAGLRAFFGLAPLSESALAASVGRGQRSSVGVHGFFHGGLIFESGHATGERLGPLVTRVPFPDQWRSVLIRAPGPIGRSGTEESNAFAKLPAVPIQVTNHLVELITANLIPAAQRAEFDLFAESVYEYGHLAGECFAAYQGGPFASPAIARLITTLRDWGIRGVGQSSWGPTVFALARDQQEAESIAGRIRNHSAWKSSAVSITGPCNSGVRMDIKP